MTAQSYIEDEWVVFPGYAGTPSTCPCEPVRNCPTQANEGLNGAAGNFLSACIGSEIAKIDLIPVLEFVGFAVEEFIQV